jgi:transcriptional regulator with XRE-family HTH domain
MSEFAHSDDSSLTEPELLGQRLREARESLGLPQSTVADHLDIPRTAVSEIEAGRRKVTFLELKRLAALYRRPIAYFSGDAPAAEDETTTALYRTTEELSSTDREQVLRFAQFLRDAGPAVPPTRARSSQA